MACCPHLADDLSVLVADPLGERQALEQIVEARRIQDDGDDVRRGCLIAADQLLGEGVLIPALDRLQRGQPGPRGRQLVAELQKLGALGVEIGLGAVDLILERGDA